MRRRRRRRRNSISNWPKSRGKGPGEARREFLEESGKGGSEQIFIQILFTSAETPET